MRFPRTYASSPAARLAMLAITLMGFITAGGYGPTAPFDNGLAVAGEIGFLERFALASDRSAALAELIPGTEDYYYYHALHFQHRQQYDQVDELLTRWIGRHGRTSRVREMQNRQAMFKYGLEPEASLSYLQNELSLRFDHQRDSVDRAAALPSQLNADLINRERLWQLALQRHNNLNGLEDAGLTWAASQDLSEDRLRELLQRLDRPDLNGLIDLVLRDLQAKNRISFGDHPIHALLLRDQLDSLLAQRPELRNEVRFVQAYLSKLRPGPETDLTYDLDARRRYLDEIWQFVATLNDAHNSLKAHVLYHQLALDLETGQYNHDRLMTYLKLPRQSSYINPRYNALPANRNAIANLGENFEQVTQLTTVGNDEAVVRPYLQHFFVRAEGYEVYAEYIRDDYLKALFAETKIIRGLGNTEQWANMLSPQAYQALRDRVDLEFAKTNARLFSSSEEVALDIVVKNVNNLLVKVYRINALNYYQDEGRHVSTNINLDGLVANEERTISSEDNPFLQKQQRLTFPELDAAGVYVVDLIGNGKNSRALIHKGRLTHVVRTSATGQAFTVLNESNQPLKDAKIWFAGAYYNANEQGEIVLPFTASPARRPVVLIHDNLASLAYFNHEAENYTLRAGIHVEREALRSRRLAPVLVRVQLLLNGTPISVKTLENVKLRISSVDHDGILSNSEVSDVELADTVDYVHQMRVPNRLHRLNLQLEGEVTSLANGQKISLNAATSYEINQIDHTFARYTPHFSREGDQYFLDVLGKTGEPIVNLPIRVRLKHREFRDPIEAILRTDETGRVGLGTLGDIVTVTFVGEGEVPEQTWPLDVDQVDYRHVIHAVTGKPIVLPTNSTASDSDDVSLLEVRGGTFVRNMRDHVEVGDHELRLVDLPVGNYDLRLRYDPTQIVIRVTDGPVHAGTAVGNMRALSLTPTRTAHITAVTATKDEAVFRIADVTPTTRVHLFAVTFRPYQDAYDRLSAVGPTTPPVLLQGALPSFYVESRMLGDEFQYILARRYAERFPGNMLRRPELLLNPWDVRDTSTQEEVLAKGTELDAAAPADEAADAEARGRLRGEQQSGDFANLDFLAAETVIALNLIPNESGEVRCELDAIAGHRNLYALVVDAESTQQQVIPLPETQGEHLDLRLAEGLDAQNHFELQKQVSVHDRGEKLVIDDLGNGRFQIYDDLAKVYRFYQALLPDSHLNEFQFVLRWHEMSDTEKRSNYSKYACHELNFFVAHKDPEFFQRTVRPYLANKLAPTFLDDYLLERDLTVYLDPWHYDQLNAAERILLAKRIDGELARTRELMENQWQLIPPQYDRLTTLFDTGLLGASLGDDDILARRLAENQVLELEGVRQDGVTPARRFLSRSAAPSPAASVPALAGGTQANRPMSSENLFDRAAGQRKAALDDKLVPGQDGAVDFFAGDLSLRERGTERMQLFQNVDKTKEWAENNYYRLPITEQGPKLIEPNDFWIDFAKQSDDAPFRSKHFAQPTHNFTEAMLALAILDLPATAPEHKIELVEQSIHIDTAGPVILLHEQLDAAQSRDTSPPILISQNFFRHGQRYRTVEGKQTDLFVTDEFLPNTVYGCQLVVTNPTSSEQKLSVLLQIPSGAVTVKLAKRTQSVTMQLAPYTTQTLEYYFYFPFTGKFPHYPAQVTQEATLVAAADAQAFNVVAELTSVDKESWDYVSQQGTEAELLNFLETRNLQEIDLGRIAFRMRDEATFDSVIPILRRRHVFNSVLWSYSIHHNKPRVVQEFLAYQDGFVSQCGATIDSELLSVDPEERKTFEHLEYHPLVNARAHQVGKERQILNDRFYEQYMRWLLLASYKPSLSDRDRLITVYYLLLQDRIAEAVEQFRSVRPSSLDSRLQYDYCQAYLSMSLGEVDTARNIANNYSDFAVDRWRNAFNQVLNHVAEIEGGASSAADPLDRDQAQDVVAANQGGFDFDLDGGNISITYQNLPQIRVRYYLMDIELLFSRNPFVQQHQGQFAYIAPNSEEQIELASATGQTTHELPEEYRNRNVLVELEGHGQRISKPHYSNVLAVQLMERYGQLRVTSRDDQAPISTVYCKVYARLKDGRTVFYKDGYTDLRGRFDYATVSTNMLDNVERFAILVLSDDRGATVREAEPPQR